MDEFVQIDTRLLRDHVSVILSEKRIAQQLHDKIAAVKRISDDTMQYQYNAILNKADNLIRYYQKMADSLDEVADRAVLLSQELQKLLRDENEDVRDLIRSMLR